MIRQSSFIVWTCQRQTGLINRPEGPLALVHCLDALYIFLGIIEVILSSISLQFHCYWMVIIRSVVVLDVWVLESELERARLIGFRRLFNETADCP
jgi:hypothetical protein